jgi:hypothetical protein
LTVSLLAVTTPAIGQARIDHSNGQVRAELAAFEREIQQFRSESEPRPPRGYGPRLVVSLRLPSAGFATARIDYLQVGVGRRVETPVGNGTAWVLGERVTWRVRGGGEHSVRLSDAVYSERRTQSTAAQQSGRGNTRVVRLSAEGVHRFVVSLLKIDGRTVVTIRRYG